MFDFRKTDGENRGLDTDVHSQVVLSSQSPSSQLQGQQQHLFLISARYEKKC